MDEIIRTAVLVVAAGCLSLIMLSFSVSLVISFYLKATREARG